MNGNLLLHPTTKLKLNYLLQKSPQAILITGPLGSGKKSVALFTAAKLLKLDMQKLKPYPYFIHVTRLKNKQDIAIEQIRDVITALKLKTPGQKEIQRIIFIEDANYLSIPAQNALLKVLEEPNSDTVFLLSTTSDQNVLPTVASRTQQLDILSVGLTDTKKYWAEQYPEAQIESAWRLSGGCVGLLSALLTEDQKHPLKESVQQARRFLSAKTYDRLLILDGLSRNKEQLALFTDALIRILGFLHHNALRNNKTKQAQNLLDSRKDLQKIQKALQANANPKLITLGLVLNLKV